jgi:hypothetical protein
MITPTKLLPSTSTPLVAFALSRGEGINAECLKRKLNLDPETAQATIDTLLRADIYGAQDDDGLYQGLIHSDDWKAEVKKAGSEEQAVQAQVKPKQTSKAATDPAAAPAVAKRLKEAKKPATPAETATAVPATAPSEFRDLALGDITIDEAVQPRLKVDVDRVDDYKDAMADGAEFTPIVVFSSTEGGYLLADGRHRFEAAKSLGREVISAEIRSGTKRDAILYGIQANSIHGIRLTRDEKQRAATKLLTDPEWQQWSKERIGRLCGLSGHTIATYMKALNRMALP